VDDRDFLYDQARRAGLPSVAALIRRLIADFRAEVEAAEVHQPGGAQLQQAGGAQLQQAGGAQLQHEPELQDVGDVHPQTEETPKMPRAKRTTWNSQLSPKPRKYSADRPMKESEKVRPPKTACPRCSAEVWATPDGEPRPHLRDAGPEDPGWSDLVPVKVACE
jgi:hypothetical protein